MGGKSIQASKNFGESYLSSGYNICDIGSFNREVVPINIIWFATNSAISVGIPSNVSVYKTFLLNVKKNTLIESKDYMFEIRKFKRIPEHKGFYFAAPVSIENKGFIIAQRNLKKNHNGAVTAYNNEYKELWKKDIQITGNEKKLGYISFQNIEDLTITKEVYSKPDTYLIYSVLNQNNGSTKYKIELTQVIFKYEPYRLNIDANSINIFGLHDTKKRHK